DDRRPPLGRRVEPPGEPAPGARPGLDRLRSGRRHHMRSCSDLPSRPVGLNTSTRISTENENTSFHSEPTPGMTVPNDSSSPSTRPPSMAPGIEPMPPITAAVNALSPIRKPMKYQIEP